MGRTKTTLKGSSSEVVLKALLRPEARKAISRNGRWSKWVDEVNSAEGHWRGVTEGLQIIDQALEKRSHSRSTGKKNRASSAPAHSKSKPVSATSAEKLANLSRAQSLSRPVSTYMAEFVNKKVPRSYDSINVRLDGKSPVSLAKHPSVLRFLSVQELDEIKDVINPKAIAMIEKWRIAEMDESKRLSVMRALRAIMGTVKGNSKIPPRSVSHQDLSWPNMRQARAATVKPSDKQPSRIPVGALGMPDPYDRVESHRSLRRPPLPDRASGASFTPEGSVAELLIPESDTKVDKTAKARSSGQSFTPKGSVDTKVDKTAKARSKSGLSHTQRSSKSGSTVLTKCVSLREVLVDGRLREMDTSHRAPGVDDAHRAEYAALDLTNSECLPLRIMPNTTMNVTLELPEEPRKETRAKLYQRPKSAPSRNSDTKQARAQAHHRRLLEATEMLREAELQEAAKADVPSQPEQEPASLEPTPVSLICHHNASSQKSTLQLNNIPLDRAGFYMNSTYQKEYNGGDKLVPD